MIPAYLWRDYTNPSCYCWRLICKWCADARTATAKAQPGTPCIIVGIQLSPNVVDCESCSWTIS